MNNRENILAFMRGEEVNSLLFFPDISIWYQARRQSPGQSQMYYPGAFIPDLSNIHKMKHDMPQEWLDWSFVDFYRNFGWGLPIHIYDWCEEKSDGYGFSREEVGNYIIEIWDTPVGTLKKVKQMAMDGSFAITRFPVETIDDLKVIEYVASHTVYEPDFQKVNDTINQIGDLGIADVVIGRSPFGKLVQEYMGLENTAYAIYEDEKRIIDFLAIQEEIDFRVIELASKTNADIVIISDHADEHLINPRWFEKYCMPFYNKACDFLHKSGKLVSTHLDGNIKNLLPLIKDTGFDLLDGCTPLPMNNYTSTELRNGLTEKQYAYCGVPSTLFAQDLDDDIILNSAQEMYDALKGKFILNVGDILPVNGSISQVIKLGEWARSRE